MHETTETFRFPGLRGTLGDIVAMTLVALLLPIGFSVPADAGKVAVIVPAALVLVYVLRRKLWCIARRVEVSPDGVRLCWVLRGRYIPARDVLDVQLVLWETIDPPERWNREGFHGPWDSPDLGPVEMYATEGGSLALLTCRTGRPLLLGVAYADEFVEAVEADVLRRTNL